MFRVLSANKHGLSEPSEITAPIQAQDTIGEQSLHVTCEMGPRATSCRTGSLDKDSNVTCGFKIQVAQQKVWIILELMISLPCFGQHFSQVHLLL